MHSVHRTVALGLTVALFSACSKGPVDAKSLLQQGEAAMDKGDWRTAVIQFKNAAAASPQDQKARWLLAKAYTSMGDAAGAEKEVRRAMEQGLAQESALPLLAQALYEQGKFDQVGSLRVPPALSPRSEAEVLAYKGLASGHHGKKEEAARYFKSALEAYPKTTLALVGQAQLAAQRGDYAAARKLVDEVLQFDSSSATAWTARGDLDVQAGKWKDAEAAFTKAIERRYDNAGELVQRAVARFELNDLKGAQADITQALRKRPGLGSASFVQGRIWFAQARYREAQQAFEQALNSGTSSPVLWFYLGLSNAIQGNWQQAEAFSEKLYAAEPRLVSARKLLAVIRMNQGRYDDVKALLSPVVQGMPNDAEATSLLASALSKKGDKAEALKLLKSLDPSQLKSAGEHMALGGELLAAGDSEAAVQQMQSALKADPNLSDAAAAKLVLQLLRQKEGEKALQAAQMLAKEHPKSSVALDLVGLAYMAKNQLPEARRSFEGALTISPGDVNANMNLASIASRQGHPDRARAHYESALKAIPNLEAAVLKLAQLDAAANNRASMVKRLEDFVAANKNATAARIVLARYYLLTHAPDKVPGLLSPIAGPDQSSPDVFSLLGQAYLAQKNAANAKLNFENLIRLQPNEASSHILLGQAELASGDKNRAKEEFEAAVRLSPTLLAGRLALARVLLYEGDAEAATPHLEYLEKKVPDDPEVVLLEAQVAEAKGNQADAARLYQKVFDKSPTTQTLLLLARHQFVSKNQAGAVATLENWLGKHPDDLSVRRVLADYERRLGNENAANAQYEAILKVAPDDLMALNNLAWNLRGDEPARALEYAQQAYSKAQTSPQVLDTLAMVLVANGQPEKALDYSSSAVNQAPDNPTILYHKAVVLEANGKKDGALSVLQGLLAKSSNFPEKAEAESLAKRLKQ